MIRSKLTDSEPSKQAGVKRKLQSGPELEIDVDAPEPPSKKALRKARKSMVHTDPRSPSDIETKALNTKRSEYGIWIGNLNFSTTQQQLHDFITGDEEHSVSSEQVTRLHLATGNPKHGSFQNKGFAYVDFADAAALANALQLSEKLFLGRRVLIKDARDFEGRPDSTDTPGKKNSSNPPSRKIFIGNLGFDVTAEELRSHFERCGAVENVHVATFEDSGKCKGYAWITFDDIPSAVAAMRGWVEIPVSGDRPARESSSRKRLWLNRIQGRKLRMEYAEDATTRYNKRFGKKASAKDAVGEQVEQTTELDDAAHRRSNRQTAPADLRKSTARGMNGSAESLEHRQKGASEGNATERQSRYSRDVVDKLQGNILPSSGKKITFA